MNLVRYWHAESDFGGPPYLTSEFEVRVWLSVSMVVALTMLGLMVFAAIAHHFVGRLPGWIHEVAAWVLLGGTYSSSAVCLLMYPEDPYDGTGFPGSTVLGAILSGVLCSVVILPFAWCLFRSRHRVASMKRSALPSPTMSNPNANLAPRDSVLAVGSVAPDFELPTQNRGENWKLSDALKKGEVVLSFFPMAFTGVCSAEMQCISGDLAKWSGKGAQVVGISCDSGPALKAWADQLGLKHTLLSDMHRNVCKAYGLYWADLNIAWRGTVVIGRDGKVKWAQKRDIPQAMVLDEILAALS